METLGGFPNLPAVVRAEQSSAASHALAQFVGARVIRKSPSAASCMSQQM
jgi:hypothetical protein